jgi:hypothetical protein
MDQNLRGHARESRARAPQSAYDDNDVCGQNGRTIDVAEQD